MNSPTNTDQIAEESWLVRISGTKLLFMFLLALATFPIIAVLMLVGISSLFMAFGMTGEEAAAWMAVPVFSVGLLALTKAKRYAAEEIICALLGFIGTLVACSQ